MPANAVSSPTASARTRIEESVETAPGTTRSPVPSTTGRDLPVSIDWSSSAFDDLAVCGHPPARADEDGTWSAILHSST